MQKRRGRQASALVLGLVFALETAETVGRARWESGNPAEAFHDDNVLNHNSRDRNILVYPDPAYQGMQGSPGDFQTESPMSMAGSNWNRRPQRCPFGRCRFKATVCT